MSDKKIFLVKLSLEERLQERIEELEKEYDKLDHTTDSGKDFDKIIELESEERTIQRVIDLIHKEKFVEITSEELELICKGLGHIENPLYDIIPTSQQIKKAEALLKKLSSFSEGFGEEETPKNFLEESK